MAPSVSMVARSRSVEMTIFSEAGACEAAPVAGAAYDPAAAVAEALFGTSPAGVLPGAAAVVVAVCGVGKNIDWWPFARCQLSNSRTTASEKITQRMVRLISMSDYGLGR